MSEQRGTITSPCCGVCALDAEDVCVGCYRTGEEITQWGAMSDEQRKDVLEKVGERERANGNFMTFS